MTRACVIGAGFGGIALAVRLQAAGIATTLVEARAHPGGWASSREIDGTRFDMCPAPLDDPGALAELWALGGRDLSADLTLLPVTPLWRLNWPDGSQLDWTSDAAEMARSVARFAPGDLAGYEQFMGYASEMRALGTFKLGDKAYLGLRSLVEALPLLLRQQAWRSLHAKAASMVKSDKLRQALGFRTLFKGGNPLAVPALHAASVRLESERGAWWPQGGMAALAGAMVALFERLGGEVRLGDPVTQIHTIGNRASEVACASGWRAYFDAVASNADVMHTYRNLLQGARGSAMADRLARRRWTPGVFSVHFALAGSWPGIPHNLMLFGPRYEDLLDDIFEHGVLPHDMMIRLAHPSATDPTLAPPGRSVFSAFVPVANLGKLPIDWAAAGPMLERRVLDVIARRLIPDLHDRLVTSFHRTPRDAALDLNAHLGSGAGLEPRLVQGLWLRPRHRDEVIGNLYLVGSGTHPGAGFGSVLTSARTVAKLIEEDLRA